MNRAVFLKKLDQLRHDLAKPISNVKMFFDILPEISNHPQEIERWRSNILESFERLGTFVKNLEHSFPEQSDSSGQIPDLVLIDDDELVRASWLLVAKKRKHTLWTFASVNEFLCAAVPAHVPIYLDYSFRGAQTGIELSSQLKSLGFSELFITTGMPLNKNLIPQHIKNVLGKDYPL